MKLYYEILTAKPYVPALVWERLIKMCPSGQFGNIFRGKLLISDPIYSEITALFESRHVYLGRETALKRKSSYYYSIKNLREYEPEDLDTATLLTVHHQVKVADEQERDEQGRLTIEAWRLMPEIRIGCVLSDAIIVSDDVRRQMEAEKLFGIVFKEIVPRPVERRLVLKNPD